MNKSKYVRQPPHPQEVWVKAFCAAATAGGCKTPEKAIEWANAAFLEYTRRWQPPLPPVEFVADTTE